MNAAQKLFYVMKNFQDKSIVAQVNDKYYQQQLS